MTCLLLLALQIAVGSRPFDPTMDVSGDRCVTSPNMLTIHAGGGLGVYNYGWGACDGSV